MIGANNFHTDVNMKALLEEVEKRLMTQTIEDKIVNYEKKFSAGKVSGDMSVMYLRNIIILRKKKIIKDYCHGTE